MDVDVTINIRYDKIENVAPGKAVTTTEVISITDTVDESVVESYIKNMTPVIPPV